MADHIKDLIGDVAMRVTIDNRTAEKVKKRHDIDTAGSRIRRIIEVVLGA